MRICFIGDAAHPNLSGWTRVLSETLGHDVHLITFNRPRETGERQTVHQLRSPAGIHKIRYLTSVGAVRRILRQIRPDVVVGYRLTSYALLASLSGFHPLVVVAQGSDLFGVRSPLVHRALTRLPLRRADLVQCWAPHMTERLLELGADPAKVLTLPKGVDTGLYRPGPSSASHEPTVISTRQLRRTYNHHVALEAMSLLVAWHPGLRFVVCGDGEFKPQLERLVSSLHLADVVTFAGRVPQAALPDRLRRAQVYLSLQPSDGVSASLLEAMACGVFPVVADNDANRQWITDGVNGFLVAPTVVAVIADRVAHALGNEALRHRAATANVAEIATRGSMVANSTEMCRRYEQLRRRHAHPTNSPDGGLLA